MIVTLICTLSSSFLLRDIELGGSLREENGLSFADTVFERFERQYV